MIQSPAQPNQSPEQNKVQAPGTKPEEKVPGTKPGDVEAKPNSNTNPLPDASANKKL